MPDFLTSFDNISNSVTVQWAGMEPYTQVTLGGIANYLDFCLCNYDRNPTSFGMTGWTLGSEAIDLEIEYSEVFGGPPDNFVTFYLDDEWGVAGLSEASWVKVTHEFDEAVYTVGVPIIVPEPGIVSAVLIGAAFVAAIRRWGRA